MNMGLIFSYTHRHDRVGILSVSAAGNVSVPAHDARLYWLRRGNACLPAGRAIFVNLDSRTRMELRERISEELLPFVRQPGQYIGGEINQLVAAGDWQRAEVRVAIAFPDVYTIGMSHLGCQILYWICNHTEGVCAERVYSPWTDAEQVMRAKGLPLFTWDTRQPASDADIFAVSLQYEMGFTNVLALLDLAGIPLRSADRDDSHPLVIAGGPQADNPEPIADFIDLVVIGDGEESMKAILALYRELKRSGVRRRDMIAEMARRLEWIYAPSLYDVNYNPDGTIRAVQASDPSLALRGPIARCHTPDFENAPFPLRPLVPYVEVVHDRISIEIMRGCPQQCRFCHAGNTKRPLRWRSVDKILDIAEQAYRATGQREVGLLSLSTSDYPRLNELAEKINERFAPRMVNISLPSLRVDKMLTDVPWMANSVRKSGLTIAVEAAADDMRAAIHKKVTDQGLFDGVKQAYRAGWKSVKLYFMAGFPGERPEDIEGIWDLCYQVSQARRELGMAPASVNAAVSWLVPKPHTPLQWAPQQTAEYFADVRATLRSIAARRRSAVHIKMHAVERSVLEAVFARGDRRLAPAIEAAYRLGARFDAWDETFQPQLWQRAFDQTGIDPAWYAHREHPSAEVLPWDHIASSSPREYLWHQYQDLLARLSAGRTARDTETGTPSVSPS